MKKKLLAVVLLPLMLLALIGAVEVSQYWKKPEFFCWVNGSNPSGGLSAASDGSTIYYRHETGLWSYDAKTGQREQLTEGFAGQLYIYKHVLYYYDGAGISARDLKTGKTETVYTASADGLCFFPYDGKLYVSELGEDGIFTVDLQTGETALILPGYTLYTADVSGIDGKLYLLLDAASVTESQLCCYDPKKQGLKALDVEPGERNQMINTGRILYYYRYLEEDADCWNDWEAPGCWVSWWEGQEEPSYTLNDTFSIEAYSLLGTSRDYVIFLWDGKLLRWTNLELGPFAEFPEAADFVCTGEYVAAFDESGHVTGAANVSEITLE